MLCTLFVLLSRVLFAREGGVKALLSSKGIRSEWLSVNLWDVVSDLRFMRIEGNFSWKKR